MVKMRRKKKRNTSWQPVSDWYQQSVGIKGGYFHQAVIFPKLLPLLDLKKTDKVLDLGCGQGVFERQLSPEIGYVGLDNSKDLLKFALEHRLSTKHQFLRTDLTHNWPIADMDFTVATMILSAQNIEGLDLVIANASKHLRDGGRLALVLNHPSFRIPRQSSWEIDAKNKLEYRRINRYLSPLKVPITAHPGKSDSQVTWSFHHPLSTYSQYLTEAGFVISTLAEWTSPKSSQGKAAKRENRAREEFPLFLTIIAQKIRS